MPSLRSQVRDKWNGFSLGGKLLIILGIIAGLVVLFMLFPVQCMCAVGGIILLFMLYAYLSGGARRRKATDEHDVHIILDSVEDQRKARGLHTNPFVPGLNQKYLDEERKFYGGIRDRDKRALGSMKKSQEDTFRKTKKRFWG